MAFGLLELSPGINRISGGIALQTSAYGRTARQSAHAARYAPWRTDGTRFAAQARSPMDVDGDLRVKKSDTQLQQDVLAELKWEPSINAAEIGVEVKDGIVTLAGHVNTYAEKWNAERATQRVAGVKALAVEMDVKIEGINNRTDADIARSVENVLQWTTYLTKDAIKVKVEKGWVTLTGEVEWQYQRQAAAESIRYLMGVSGVSDQITIKTKATAPAVKSDIEAALKRRAQKEAHEISVSVHGTDVTLTGTVHSWSERELARNTAWGSPGVRSVVDNTTMSY
jgi:osmotically-inducible protein OsmY